MALVIDGVFFQLANSGIARVWSELVPRLPRRLDMPVVFLDRTNEALTFEGVEVVPFPSYRLDQFNPADSQLLQKICDHYKAKVFSSTYYTTPLETPSVSVVYDMIPERFDFDLAQRAWKEKETAISHALRHLCISENTRKDLLEFYTELDPAAVKISHCGVNMALFKPAPKVKVDEFRLKYKLARDYFIFVGSRDQHKNYKNSKLFFDAIDQLDSVDFDVVCVGGEPTVPKGRHAGAGQKILRLDLSDLDLVTAYTGASALVYPSLYEGFGLPVIEAMASGCPVITTRRGSLGEIVGDAILEIAGDSIDEMTAALANVRMPDTRKTLLERGKRQAATFGWDRFADAYASMVRSVAREGRSATSRSFYRNWGKIRSIQGNVDVAF